MSEKRQGQLWIAGWGAGREELAQLSAAAGRIYYRGQLPGAWLEAFEEAVDVEKAFSSHELDNVWERAVEQLGQGEAIAYVSLLPLNSDSLLAELISSTHAKVHLVSETPSPISPADEISAKLADGAAFLDGARLRGRYYPSFPPSMSALIFSPALAGSPQSLHAMLRQVYPEDHTVYVKSGYQPDERWQPIPLERLAYDSFPLLMIPHGQQILLLRVLPM